MESKYRLTREKIRELKAELFNLKVKKSSELVDRFLHERYQNLGEGDDPFLELKEDKNLIQEKISEIENILKNSIELKVKATDKVALGSKVIVETDNMCDEFQIVTSLEAEPFKRKVSDQSPLGKALLGKSLGDTVSVDMGSFCKEYKIISIK